MIFLKVPLVEKCGVCVLTTSLSCFACGTSEGKEQFANVSANSRHCMTTMYIHLSFSVG